MTQLWREMARNLNAYQGLHWHELTTVQHLDLNAYQNSLLTRAQDTDERAYLLLTEPTEPTFMMALRQIKRAAQTLQDSPEQMIALNLGALTVALAAGITRNNTRTIQLSLSELSVLTEGAVVVK
ncbi:MAG: hypothetical protein LH609_07845 [Rudanella sp.]|nr:hypothetical protein [Rudanella sp.]